MNKNEVNREVKTRWSVFIVIRLHVSLYRKTRTVYILSRKTTVLSASWKENLFLRSIIPDHRWTAKRTVNDMWRGDYKMMVCKGSALFKYFAPAGVSIKFNIPLTFIFSLTLTRIIPEKFLIF